MNRIVNVTAMVNSTEVSIAVLCVCVYIEGEGIDLNNYGNVEHCGASVSKQCTAALTVM